MKNILNYLKYFRFVLQIIPIKNFISMNIFMSSYITFNTQKVRTTVCLDYVIGELIHRNWLSFICFKIC